MMTRLLVALAAAAILLGDAANAGIPAPRTRAPDFTATAVVNGEFKDVRLSERLEAGGGWIGLLFLPAAFTFACPTEILAFQTEEFDKLGAEILVVSTDTHHTLRAWDRTPRTQGGLGGTRVPLVSDVTKSISKAYGVLVEDEDDGMRGLALRGFFLIDPKGMVRHVQVNDDAVARNHEEALRLLSAFQFADAHGEVCPSKWRGAGDPTIVPNPDASRAFFEAHGDEL